MADQFKPAQIQKLSLAGSGCSSSATSITLKSFKLPNSSTTVAMSDLGTIAYITLEPGTSREEQISFTGVTQNGDGTATLTGVTRGINFVDPYDELSANKYAHSGGAVAVLSNTSGFYGKVAIKSNDEAITGYWTVPDPIGNTDIANKQWVAGIVNGGAISINSMIASGTAGETVAAGNLVYLKQADGYWWKTDADTAATVDNVQLGIAQGAGTAGNSISGGVLLRGVDANNTGTGGAYAYASNTAGAIGTSTGTTERIVGQFIVGSSGLYFDPAYYYTLTAIQKTSIPSAGEKLALAAGSTFGTPSSTNKYITQDYNSSATGLPVVRTYLNAASPATWTKPAGLKYVIVEVQAGGGSGGGGGANNNDRGSGGGAGGYSKKQIAAATLGATETVTTGAAGAASSFGAHATTTAGSGGTNATSGIILGGSGGTGSSGDINVSGDKGFNAVTYDGVTYISGRGASSKFGVGGAELTSGGAGNAASGYGSGGGGGWGSAGNPTAAGAGAAGIVIITEYYN